MDLMGEGGPEAPSPLSDVLTFARLLNGDLEIRVSA
jgi:hypothetical protein